MQVIVEVSSLNLQFTFLAFRVFSAQFGGRLNCLTGNPDSKLEKHKRLL